MSEELVPAPTDSDTSTIAPTTDQATQELKKQSPQTTVESNLGGIVTNTEDSKATKSTKNITPTDSTPTAHTNPTDTTPTSQSAPSVNSYDDIPIGGGKKKNKLQMSQYPDGSAPPPPLSVNPYDDIPIGGGKKKEKLQISQYPDNSAPPPPPSVNPYDDIPIGGGKKKDKLQISQYPDDCAPPPPKAKKPTLTKKTTKAVDPHKDQIAANTTSNAPPPNPDDIPIQPASNNTMSQFDDKPIGKTNSNQFSEYPEGDEPQVVDVKYTMMQKLNSKAPKLRLGGFEDLQLTLEGNNPSAEDNAALDDITIANYLKETAPANLEKITQCLKLWVQKKRRWDDTAVKNLIESSFANGKGNTKKVAVEVIDLMYENSPSMVETNLLIGLGLKTPKLVATYASVVNDLLAIYGIRKMKLLKPYYGQLVRLITNEKNVAVKTECMNLIKEAYKWLGKDAIEPLINNLKDVVKKELDSFWDSHDKTIVMTAPKDDAVAAGGAKGGAKKIDAYELSEAVDIFKKYNEKWASELLKLQKWNEKTKLMEQFVKAASVPKLANTDFKHITDLMKRLINDSNFNVVLYDLRMMAALAKGLRRPFGPTIKMLLQPIIAKFRDKKTQMIEETNSALVEFLYALNFDDLVDDLKQGLADKAPNMKVNIINWLGKFIDSKIEEKGQFPDKNKDSMRSFFSTFEKLLADGVAQVRDCMARMVGRMKIQIGEDFVAPLEGKLSKGQASKAGEATVVIKAPVKESKPQKPASVAPPPNKSSIREPQKTVSLRQTIEAPPKEDSKLECYEDPTFDDSWTALVEQGLSEEELKNANATGFKERQNLMNTIKDMGSGNLNAVIRVFKKLYKDWRESNLVMNKELVAWIQEQSPNFGKPQTYIFVPLLLEKIGDNKFAQPLLKAVDNICRNVPGTFLAGHIIKFAKSTEGKKPKLNSDACSIVARIIDNVSASNIPVKEAIEFGKDCYQVLHSKKGAAQMLVKLYSYLGDQVKVLLDQTTAKALEQEFKNTKVLSADQRGPKIQLTGQAAASARSKPVNLLESRPKVDISADVAKYLPKMNDTNWQSRKDAVQNISKLIADNHGRVIINCLNDVIPVLSAHINDPHKSLVKPFITLVGHVFTVMGEREIKAQAKHFVGLLVQALADKSDINRKEVIVTFHKIADTLGKEQFLVLLGPHIDGDRESRVEVINFILQQPDVLANLTKADMKDYIKGIVNGLIDKNKQVRALCEKLLQKVVDITGVDVFRTVGKDSKQAFIKDLNNIFDKYAGQGAPSEAVHDKMGASSLSMSHKNTTSPAKIIAKQVPQISSNALPPPELSRKVTLQKLPSQKSTAQPQYFQSPSANNFMRSEQSYCQPDQVIASVKYLSSQRNVREEQDEAQPWQTSQIKDCHQQQVISHIYRLFSPQIAKKMLSFNHKRVLQSIIQLLKICMDVSYQSHLRETYDLLIKWSYIRFWGGSPGLTSIFQLMPALLSVMEKKSVSLTEARSDLLLALIREYILSTYLANGVLTDSLFSAIKSLVVISSGERVLRKILKQFSVDITTIHRHFKKQATVFYRQGLLKIIKTHLVDHLGTSENLQEASKIKQIKADNELVSMLYRRLHENVLNNLGFKMTSQSSTLASVELSHSQVQNPNSAMSQTPNLSSVNNNSNGTRFFQSNASQVGQPQPVVQPQRSHNSSSPQPHLAATMNNLITGNVDSGFPNSSNFEQFGASSRVGDHASRVTAGAADNLSYTSRFIGESSRVLAGPIEKDPMDLSQYQFPNTTSPLGKQLTKLIPPNQTTINFFTSLFVQNSKKIEAQLTSNAKIILGSILKSVIMLLGERNKHQPEVIVAQINLLQQAVKCKHIIKNIGSMLTSVTAFTLRQLVYEDENKSQIAENLLKREISFPSDNFIKVINAVMLRILENANGGEVINILLKLLIEQSFVNMPSVRTTNLITKCVTRAAPSAKKEPKQTEVEKFLTLSNEYLSIINMQTSLAEFFLPQLQKPKPEQSMINNIKIILTDLAKTFGEQLWQNYNAAIERTTYPDRCVGEFLGTLDIGARPVNPEQQLKKITELLAKKKSYTAGIVSLQQYISDHGQFNVGDYFTRLGYDLRFIQMVQSSLEGKPSRTPSKHQPREDKSQRSRNSQHEIGNASSSSNNFFYAGNAPSSSQLNTSNYSATPNNKSMSGDSSNNQTDHVKEMLRNLKSKYQNSSEESNGNSNTNNIVNNNNNNNRPTIPAPSYGSNSNSSNVNSHQDDKGSQVIRKIQMIKEKYSTNDRR